MDRFDHLDFLNIAEIYYDIHNCGRLCVDDIVYLIMSGDLYKKDQHILYKV